MSTHQKKAAGFVFTLFAAALLVISGATTFGFFHEFFSGFVPAELFGADVARLISGSIGLLLLDVASAIWLATYLKVSETPERRAIALTMTLLAFIGAAAASVAHLSLTATSGQIAVDTAARGTIGNVALVTVIAAVVLNFGAALAFNRYSKENKDQVRESDRLDTVQSAEDEQASHLDKLIAQQVKQLLNKQAPELAAMQARRIVAGVMQRERAKYAEVDTNNDGRFSQAEIDQWIASNPDRARALVDNHNQADQRGPFVDLVGMAERNSDRAPFSPLSPNGRGSR